MNAALTAALAMLPHGPEFRFIDRLRELEPGRRGVGEYRVRGNEPFLRGHFPDAPMLPGVLLIEAAAQLAGVVAQSDPARAPLRGLKLTAVRQVKITGTARPGEMLTVRAEITGRLGGLVQARVRAQAGPAEVLTGELTLSGEPGPTSV